MNIVVKYNPAFQPGSGTVSQITWNNPDMKRALKHAFSLREGEIISGLEITETGVKAYIERM